MTAMEIAFPGDFKKQVQKRMICTFCLFVERMKRFLCRCDYPVHLLISSTTSVGLISGVETVVSPADPY